MKKPGNTSDFIEQRDKELYAAFLEALKNPECKSLAEMHELAANTPCSRFWVSEQRAALVVSEIYRFGADKALADAFPQRKRMYLEIFRRVVQLRSQKSELCLLHAVAEVIEQPAPEFYLTPLSSKITIYKIARRRRLARKLQAKRNSNTQE
ncbi:MAG: hypothetical protein K2M87_04640 [Muribaculaceae bacterium]|nr:hypothetical protein [Muribaculaceae bacterium]